jgi:hypothetical protein
MIAQTVKPLFTRGKKETQVSEDTVEWMSRF